MNPLYDKILSESMLSNMPALDIMTYIEVAIYFGSFQHVTEGIFKLLELPEDRRSEKYGIQNLEQMIQYLLKLLEDACFNGSLEIVKWLCKIIGYPDWEFPREDNLSYQYIRRNVYPSRYDIVQFAH